MAFIQVEIESYTVLAIRDSNINTTRYEIHLTSKALEHGIRFLARLIFSDPANNKAYILNADGLNFDPKNLVVFYNRTDFTSFYQVLSTERPVYYWFVYSDTVSNDLAIGVPLNSHLIIQCQLKTGSEVPGDFEK